MVRILLIIVLVSLGTACDSHGSIFDRIVSGEIAETKTGKVPPKPIQQVIPIFPEALREAGITGDVEVQFTINSEGSTRDIQVLKSTHELFSESVIFAIKQWVFYPGTENSRPVDCKVKMTIPFTNKKTKPVAEDDKPS